MVFVMPWLYAGPVNTGDPIGPPTTLPTPDSRLDEIIKEKPPSEPAPFWASQWSGVYADVNASTTLERLEVTANSVVYHSQGCFHNFTERSRIVGVTKDGLCLVEDKPHEEDGEALDRFLGSELVFFRWDNAQFCATRFALIRRIHSHNFRVTSWYEPSLLRKVNANDPSVDWTPREIPDFPKDLQRFLRTTPLTISITEFGPFEGSEQRTEQCGVSEVQWTMRCVVNDGEMPVVGSGFTLAMAASEYEPEIGLVEIESVQDREISARLRASKRPANLQIAVGTQVSIQGCENLNLNFR